MSVTAADMSHRRDLPRRRLLTAILAVSVALNICVIAGALWSRLHPPPPTFTQRFHRLEDKLDLNADQRAAFDRYIADMSARGEQMRHTIEPMMDTAWAELAKPDADQARVLQLLNDASDQRHTFQQQAVAATLSLLATLTPEQRSKFVANEREFHAALRRRHAEEAR